MSKSVGKYFWHFLTIFDFLTWPLSAGPFCGLLDKRHFSSFHRNKWASEIQTATLTILSVSFSPYSLPQTTLPQAGFFPKTRNILSVSIWHHAVIWSAWLQGLQRDMFLPLLWIIPNESCLRTTNGKPIVWHPPNPRSSRRWNFEISFASDKLRGILGQVFCVILHSEQSTKMPPKFRPKFRPIFRPASRLPKKMCRRNFALGNFWNNNCYQCNPIRLRERHCWLSCSHPSEDK